MVTVHSSRWTPKVGVLLEILRRGLLASLTSEGGGTDQSGDVCCQRRRRVSAGFFPAFLRSDWPVMDKIAGRFQDHRIRVKVLKSLGLMQAPGQNNGECGLIQLMPHHGFTVDQKFG